MMNGNYLLDTNVIIDILRKNKDVIEKVNEANSVCISAIVLGELYFGAFNADQLQKHLQETEEIQNSIKVIPVSKTTSRHYGIIRASLKKKTAHQFP